MDLNQIGLFVGLTKRMSWLTQRARVLSQNIANSDTPGYTARDLKPMSFRDALGASGPRLEMAATRPGHIVQAGAAASSVKETGSRKDTYESAPTGNSVVLEEQMVKMAENQLDYRLITNLYRKNVDLLKAVIGGRG